MDRNTDRIRERSGNDHSYGEMRMTKREILKRDDFLYFTEIQTRWMDNDLYGHVNNAVYYSYFDTAVNRYTIEVGGLDIHQGEVIGLVVETMCQYHQPASFPERLEAGLRVAHLGNSSVRYEIGIFREGSGEPLVTGYFVHVFVDRRTRKPHPIPETIRAGMRELVTKKARE